MAARQSLEKEIALVFINDQRLDTMVRSVLQQPLNYFVPLASFPTMITGLFNEIEKEQMVLLKFLGHLINYGSTPELKGAARAYLDEQLGIVSPELDPYKDLIVLGQPFADRQSFRDKLKVLLASRSTTAHLLPTGHVIAAVRIRGSLCVM